MTQTQTPLKRLLEDEGRKQTWLSERTGIEVSRLSRIVNGLHPRDDEAQAIATTLRRDVAELFEAVAA